MTPRPTIAGENAAVQDTPGMDLCVLISSCDPYQDAWQPFLTLFDRYWPDCPWPVFLISNQSTIDHPRVHSLTVGADQGWASNLITVLDRLQPASILYLQEDYFLQSRVDTSRLLSVIDYALAHDIGFVRLAGGPDPDMNHSNPFGLGELGRGLKFRCSLQAAWWKTDTLRKLLVPGETGWNMEMAGSARSNLLPETFLGVHQNRPLLDYVADTAILKGKWMPAAVSLCRREGIRLDLSHRPVQSRVPLLLKQLRKSRPVRAIRGALRSLLPGSGKPVK